MCDKVVSNFWKKWTLANGLKRYKIIQKLNLPEMKLYSTIYNSYFEDLDWYARSQEKKKYEEAIKSAINCWEKHFELIVHLMQTKEPLQYNQDFKDSLAKFADEMVRLRKIS